MAIAKQPTIREIPSLVHDAVNLEGIAMILPETQTILDGITVGGHKISDQNMAINQAKTWKYLFSMISENTFRFSKEVALKLHLIAGQKEFNQLMLALYSTAQTQPMNQFLRSCLNQKIVVNFK